MLSATATNNANYESRYTYTDPTNDVTPVGAFASSPGPYGTYDMGGEVFQWNEANSTNFDRYLRGGAWCNTSGLLTSSYRYVEVPTWEDYDIGFRVASVAWGWHDRGDANGDGQVDVNDLTVLLSNLGKMGCVWSQGCMAGDPTGTVDINDLTIVLGSFGTTYGASATGLAAVPEPSCFFLVGVAIISRVACACWRRR